MFQRHWRARKGTAAADTKSTSLTTLRSLICICRRRLVRYHVERTICSIGLLQSLTRAHLQRISRRKLRNAVQTIETHRKKCLEARHELRIRWSVDYIERWRKRLLEYRLLRLRLAHALCIRERIQNAVRGRLVRYRLERMIAVRLVEINTIRLQAYIRKRLSEQRLEEYKSFWIIVQARCRSRCSQSSLQLHLSIWNQIQTMSRRHTSRTKANASYFTHIDLQANCRARIVKYNTYRCYQLILAIQTLARRYLSRDQAIWRYLCYIGLQSLCRSKLRRIEAAYIYNRIIKVQSLSRGHFSRSIAFRNYTTYIDLQTRCRSRLAWYEATRRYQLVLSIQALSRSWCSRIQANGAYFTCIDLQALCRTQIARYYTTSRRCSIIAIQSRIRGYLCLSTIYQCRLSIRIISRKRRECLQSRIQSKNRKLAVDTIGRHRSNLLQMRIQRERFLRAVTERLYFISMIRKYLIMNRMSLLKHAVSFISLRRQHTLWSRQLQDSYKAQLNYRKAIQHAIRGHLARLELSNIVYMERKREIATIQLQSAVRGHSVRVVLRSAQRRIQQDRIKLFAVITIQRWYRVCMYRRGIARRQWATSIIQAFWRGYSVRKRDLLVHQRARRKILQLNKNVDKSMTMTNRTSTALKTLDTGNTLTCVSKACYHLGMKLFVHDNLTDH